MKTIIKVDASAFKSGACDQALSYTILDGYREPLMYNDTQYGIAFHGFASRMAESNGDFAEAHRVAMALFRMPNKVRDEKKTKHLTEKHLINTCVSYFNDVESKRSNFDYIINPVAKCWKCKGIGYTNAPIVEHIGNEPATQEPCPICKSTGINAQPLVEITFEIKVYEDEDYIIYVDGTIDRLGKIKNGAYCIRDYKTTSQWDADKFLSSFRCSVQFKLYIWALRRMAKDNPESVIATFAKSPLVAFIDGIFLKSNQETQFQTSDAIQYKEWELEEFEILLAKQVHRILNMARNKSSIERNGKMLGLCYTGFYCKYHNVCHALDSVVSAHVLKNSFKQKPYDPLNFRD